MSAARELQVSESAETPSADTSGVFPLGSLHPPTSEEIEAKQHAHAARQRRRKAASVMVFGLLGTATGLSVFALAGIAAKVIAGAIGGVILGAVAVAPSGRIDR